MPTNQQLRTIHQGARFVGLVDKSGDARYRLMLRNVANVESARDLDNTGIEDVMAVIEGLGFDGHPAGPHYWQNKVAARGRACGERAVHKITELAGHAAVRYPLESLCYEFSDGRTTDPNKLKPSEAWKLIEMLKAIIAREQNREAAARTAAAL